jgi:hypothetical protein
MSGVLSDIVSDMIDGFYDVFYSLNIINNIFGFFKNLGPIFSTIKKGITLSLKMMNSVLSSLKFIPVFGRIFGLFSKVFSKILGPFSLLISFVMGFVSTEGTIVDKLIGGIKKIFMDIIYFPVVIFGKLLD